jgi:hypothetical protein
MIDKTLTVYNPGAQSGFYTELKKVKIYTELDIAQSGKIINLPSSNYLAL